MEQDLYEIEVSSKKIEKTENHDEFYSYRGYTKEGWLDLRFTKQCQEKLTEEQKTILQKRNFKIKLNYEDFNVNSKGKFDIIYITGIVSAEEIAYKSKKDKYFSK